MSTILKYAATVNYLDRGQIKDAVGNEYGKPKDVVGPNRYAFTSHADSAFDVCFENLITQCAYNILAKSE